MSIITDNFARANGPLGGNWGPVIPNNAESGPNTFQSGVLISGGGFGPINAFGGDACSLWAGGQTFQNDQWASVTVNSVAPSTAVLSITAATQSGGNTTYTYTVTSGSVAAAISGGFLAVQITGMQNAANNGSFLATTFGPGTFTVTNAGVTESGSSGSGNVASDSGGGVLLRASGSNASNITGYFLHRGTNSFGLASRTAYFELWKVINGVGTSIATIQFETTLPVIGDVLTLIVSGTTLTAMYNNAVIYQATDSSISSGSSLGVWAWSMNGPNEFNWSAWPTSPTASGNSGTTFNNLIAGDDNYIFTSLASDLLTEGTSLTQVVSDNFTRASGSLGSNWVPSVGSVVINGNLCEASSGTSGAGARNAVYWGGGQTFSNDQYAEATISALTGTALGGPVVRTSFTGVHGTTAETGYICLIPKTGSSGNVIVQKDVNGSVTSILTIPTITPQVGDVFRISAVGTTITVFRNGSSIGSVTDSSITSGFPGLFLLPNGNGQGSCAFSSWAGGGTGVPSQFTTLANQNFASGVTGAFPTVIDAAGVIALIFQNSVVWPNDQYSQCTLVGSTAGTGPAVRLSTSSDTGYAFVLGNASTAKLIKLVSGVTTTITSLPYTFNSGDVFRIEVVGTTIVCKINGVMQIVVQDSSIASGSAGLMGLTASSSASVSTWSAGSITSSSSSVAYSVPDCRVSPFGPNMSRIVQGTKTYDVQTSSNSAVPSKDCRVQGAPVDCRISPNIPQNSRTPGTFGPGE